MNEERIAKRIKGIARRWRGTFGLPYHMLDDLIQIAWLLWLERDGLDTEQRFDQVNSATRRAVIKEIWGMVPTGAVITNVLRPVTVSSEYIGAGSVDFDGYVEASRIANRCAKNRTHALTLAMIAGTKPVTCTEDVFRVRRNRLRKFLGG